MSAPDKSLATEQQEDAAQALRRCLSTDLREPYRIPDAYLLTLKGGAEAAPACSQAQAPLLAFINARSGGRAGAELYDVLCRALGNAQVFDLGRHQPAAVLQQLWAVLLAAEAAGDAAAAGVRQRLRILAAGGDGTVAWVLKCVRELRLQPPPPVAIIPLGTGNDLARSFGWGHTLSRAWIADHVAVCATMLRMARAAVEQVDCWELRLVLPEAALLVEKPHSLSLATSVPRSASGGSGGSGAAAGAAPAVVAPTEAEAAAPARPESAVKLSGAFWNYFSVGLDAKAAHGFHSMRETRPWLAAGRLINQAWYSVFACQSGWFCCSTPLASKVAAWVLPPGGGGDAGGDAAQSARQWRQLPLPPAVRALVLVNLQSYAGGRNIWGVHHGSSSSGGSSSGGSGSAPSYCDGTLELVGFNSGYHAALVMGTGGALVHGVRLAQAAAVRLELKASLPKPDGTPSRAYMQLDGEPWMQHIPSGSGEAPITVEVTHGGTCPVLRNATRWEAMGVRSASGGAPSAAASSSGSGGGGKPSDSSVPAGRAGQAVPGVQLAVVEARPTPPRPIEAGGLA